MVTVIGGWQSDFARNWAREGMEIADGFAEALGEGMAETGIEPADIQTGHVGNFVADMFAKQGLLGGLFAQVHPELDGLPTSRHEAACASGSMAIIAASAEIEAGRYETACVLGLELMRNVPGQEAADNLGAAIWQGHELQDAVFPWPRAFSDLSEEYERRYGLDYRHLMRISEINFQNAKANPNAQTRSWQFTDKSFTSCDEANPVVEGRTRKMDCGQVTDGAAVVFLASDEWADAWARKRGIPQSSLSRITGWGHRSAPISYRSKIKASENESYVFPQVRRAVMDARERAKVDLEDIDAFETHDCFAMTEYMAIDHLGLTEPGEAWKAIEDGAIELGGKQPINPSGGLIGLGHPVGATGVRMVLDAHKQVTGAAGDYQVEGARRMQTLNIGGSTTTTASFIVESAKAA